MPRSAEQGAAADAAVVLGAAVWAGGQASPTLARRALHGVALLHSGGARHLLLTGGVGRHPPSEASVMRALALRAGVPAARIVVDETSTTTLESARACAAIIAARGWRRVLVVTDRYHLPRALLAFRRFGVTAQGSPPPESRGDTASWKQVLLSLRELVAIPWYVVRLTVEKRKA